MIHIVSNGRISFFFKIRHSSIHSWLHGVSVVAWGLFIAAGGLSLVVASRGYSLVVVGGLLIAVASLVEERGLWGLQQCGSQAPELELSSCGAWA